MCVPVCVPVCVGKGSPIRFNLVTALKRRQFFYPSLPPLPQTSEVLWPFASLLDLYGRQGRARKHRGAIGGECYGPVRGSQCAAPDDSAKTP